MSTLTGKRWFVTFIDDNIRLCWIYSKKTKSEVENLFKGFYTYKQVENQFLTKISILQNDNGIKYFNHYLRDF